MAVAHGDDGGRSFAHQTFEDGEESDSQDEADGQDEDDDEQGSGDYATLHVAGAQTSAGSIGHPDECMPCTFYCFTRRGCNRGQDCRFCHLTHQSKLQLRREAWKRQQREKRKSIRERVAQEALARRTTALARGHLSNNDRQGCTTGITSSFHDLGDSLGSNAVANGRAGKSQKLKDIVSKAEQGDMGADFRSQGHLYLDFDMPHFTYIPGQATLTLGQSVEIWPKLAEAPVRFQLGTPLPAGLSLNPSNGVIQGTPVRAVGRMTVVVQAVLANNRMMRGSVDIDVVDFTHGGYVVGHISEIEPGRFMMLLHVPDAAEDVAGASRGSHKQVAHDGGRQARKLVANKKGGQALGQAWALQGARVQNGHASGLHGSELLQHQQMVEPSSAFMQRF